MRMMKVLYVMMLSVIWMFIDWERLQMKIMIILEQAYQAIGSLCNSTKQGIVEVEIKKYKLRILDV